MRNGLAASTQNGTGASRDPAVPARLLRLGWCSAPSSVAPSCSQARGRHPSQPPVSPLVSSPGMQIKPLEKSPGKHKGLRGYVARQLGPSAAANSRATDGAVPLVPLLSRETPRRGRFPRAAAGARGGAARGRGVLGTAPQLLAPALEASGPLSSGSVVPPNQASQLPLGPEERKRHFQKFLHLLLKILSWNRAAEGPGPPWVCGERLGQRQGCRGP